MLDIVNRFGTGLMEWDFSEDLSVIKADIEDEGLDFIGVWMAPADDEERQWRKGDRIVMVAGRDRGSVSYERNYHGACSPLQIEEIVASFSDQAEREINLKYQPF